MRPPRGDRRQLAQDGAVALAVGAVGQLDVWAPAVTQPNLVGARPAIATFYALTALVLVARRRRPLAVVVAIAAVDVVHFLVLGASEGMGTLLPVLVAVYSVAAHRERRPALAGGGLVVAVVVLHELRNPDNVDFASVADAVAWDLTVVGAWLAGAYMRTRRLLLAELAERAARAEYEREERARAAAVQERGRIARELHDVVAHHVSVMVVQAEGAQALVSRDPERAQAGLGRVARTGRETLVELRRLLGVLRDHDGGGAPGRRPQPGLQDLGALLEQVRGSGLAARLEVVGQPMALPPGLELSAYRIVQEALTNVLKHAGPARARVVVAYEGDHLRLEVGDDGRGASANGAGAAGPGLAGMRERVALHGGELEAGPAPGAGYRIRARLPLSGA